jgi:2-(1,2-epoxy-1,2-dihydrophenyl)acetyl-CoA isomerase
VEARAQPLPENCMSRCVDVTLAGAIAKVALNDPPTRNALGSDMASQLCSAFAQLASNESVRVVLLSGTGASFSSGGNLNEALSIAGDPQSAARFMENFNALMRTVFFFPKPVISVVRGSAAGGALGLLLCTDIILLARSAKLMQAFIHVALAPDCGTSQLLAGRVGFARAKEMTLTGRQVAAEEALRIGLGDALHDDDGIASAADELAALIAARPPLASSNAKQLMQRARFASFDEVLEMEATVQCQLLQTEDFREGATAFREKRRPTFIGR